MDFSRLISEPWKFNLGSHPKRTCMFYRSKKINYIIIIFLLDLQWIGLPSMLLVLLLHLI